MTSRRCVFFIGGYDRNSPQSFVKRMQREFRHFERTWDVETSLTGIGYGSADVASMTAVTSKQDAWKVTTDFHFLGLEELVARDARRLLPVRVFRYLVAFCDYVVSGTAFAFFAKNWRFALYFLYPAVGIAFLFVALWLAASGILYFAGLGSSIWPTIVALVAFFPVLATIGRRMMITHLMDLWSFSREYIRGRRSDADAMLENYAALVSEITSQQQFDEIVFIGHSTGGGLILDIVARALKRDPALTSRAANTSVLTLGSTALKFGLHRAATDFRGKVKSLVDETRLKWWEFQCLVDVINFYKTDPVEAMGLNRPGTDRRPGFPIVHIVHVRDMLDRATYKRMRGNFFRIHYQFVSANRLRYRYDFFMTCFGPHPVPTDVEELEANFEFNGGVRI